MAAVMTVGAQVALDQRELTALNIGETLDKLCNLDPRGYGVCNILYRGSREYTGYPLTMNMAKRLDELLKPDELVYIITGFVLRPHRHAETDGIIGSMLLARALVVAYGVHPVIICQHENLDAIKPLASVCGLHSYFTVEEALEYPAAVAAVPFTKDINEAEKEAARLASYNPAAVIAVESAGANELGVYHNATGLDMTELEAKSDVLFDRLASDGVPTFAIGDLGNETGMGAIGDYIKQNIPYAQKNACRCGCGGGIAAQSAADTIITATVSDWAAYGLIAAIAWLRGNIEIMHDENMEKEALYAASRAGMVDMYGWLIPAIDGMDCSMNCSIVSLMRGCVKSALSLTETCRAWFDRVIDLQ